ncbi:MAG: hypothetical protein ACYS9T_12255, partial [Planctomycetota bacterium]
NLVVTYLCGLGGRKMSFHKGRKGSAFLMSIIVLVAISAWAVSLCSFSGVNVQLADNQRKADGARACAESGLEVMRFWLDRFGTRDPSLVFDQLESSLRTDLASNDIYNITMPYYDGSHISILPVTLDSADGKGFFAELTEVDSETIRLEVTGTYGTVTKKISVNYKFGVKRDTVFDFGVATKGPLHLAGNIELEGNRTFTSKARIKMRPCPSSATRRSPETSK